MHPRRFALFALVSFRYWRLNFIMPRGISLPRALSALRGAVLIPICFAAVALLQAQVAKQSVPENPISDADGITSKSATNGFFRGRLLPGKSSAELRRRAFKAKLSMRAQHALLPYALWLFLPGVVIGWAALRNDAKRKIHRLRSIIVLLHVTLSLLSCGCVSTGDGTTSSSGNQLVTDYITVTGTSPGVTPDAG